MTNFVSSDDYVTMGDASGTLTQGSTQFNYLILGSQNLPSPITNGVTVTADEQFTGTPEPQQGALEYTVGLFGTGQNAVIRPRQRADRSRLGGSIDTTPCVKLYGQDLRLYDRRIVYR